MTLDISDARIGEWLVALDRRHLSSLTPSEVGRALRALSSCYVERRSRLAEGGALGTAGKRAAFALFYAPLHLLTIRQIVRALEIPGERVDRLYDLGCGTGASGGGWALEAPHVRVSGLDRHPWAVAEANWTYRQLAIHGRATQRDVARVHIAADTRTGILAAYTVNELPEHTRRQLLDRLVQAHARGAAVLIAEPISRRVSPWWNAWVEAFAAAGGRSDEWRFSVPLPARQRNLAKAAGLNPQELTARTLFLP